MKTMTCREMGGPCDTPVKGATAEEMMANGGKHIQEEAAKGDEAHKKVLEMMADMKKNPDSPENKAWTDKFNAGFAAKPEDQ